MIKIIERTDSDLEQETLERYELIKPYLEDGLPITKAVQKALNLKHLGFQNRTWYKNLRDYAISQGYVLQR